jgi:putative sigma-54 modulation protein
MQVQIFDRHISLSDNQLEYIREKVFNLKDYGEQAADESTQARVDVESNKIKTSNKNITVQVTIFVPHAVIRAEVYSTTVEEGIDLAVEKLKKQLERYKGKKNRRDKSGKWIPSSTLEEISSTQEVGAVIGNVSKRKAVTDLNPMHEEEAIEQMELLGHNFYGFMNTENNRFNVVYRREDGSYGLLDFASKGEK